MLIELLVGSNQILVCTLCIKNLHLLCHFLFSFEISELEVTKKRISVLERTVETLQKENVGKLSSVFTNVRLKHNLGLLVSRLC